MAAKPKTVEAYGRKWPADMPPLRREFTMMAKTDAFLRSEGRSLFYHYKRAQQLLWPDDDHSRWTDLLLREILGNTITAVLGPKDSGKTHVALSRFGLTDYFAFPGKTLILMSSTDLRGLELRVWGDLKNLFERAHERHPWLAGNLVDSRHAICTDNLNEDAVRDMRKGIICFIRGSLVDTPDGQRPIESLREGDSVFNAVGVGCVRETHERIAPTLVRVSLSDGRTIDCTPEHPFLTRRGWLKAVDLRTCDKVFSCRETVRLLRRSTGSGLSESKTLLGTLSRAPSTSALRLLPQILSPAKAKTSATRRMGPILQYYLREPLGGSSWSRSTQSQWALSDVRQADEAGASQPDVLLRPMPRYSRVEELLGVWESFPLSLACQDEVPESVLRHILQAEICSEESRWETFAAHERGTGFAKAVSESRVAPSHLHRPAWDDSKRQSPLVRGRHGLSVCETGRGNRWGTPPDTREQTPGRCANAAAEETWVDSVTFLESGSDPRFDECAGGYHVHNLEVEGHPSYSVNGVVVHNCIPCLSAAGQYLGLGRYVGAKQERRRLLADEAQFMSESFLDAIANLNSGDFRGVFCGNPLGTGDPLDKIAEPRNGWSSIPEPTKTTVWDNRFAGGRTINLVGTDSPNFDYPQDQPKRFPYLIGAKEVSEIETFYGRNSLQYYSQALGIRKTGLRDNRVLTREICQQFGAFDDVVWRGGPLTRLYALDAGYGGDRCVGGAFEFGEDVNKNVVLSILPPTVVPVTPDPLKSPEDQIAEFVKADCERLGIQPSRVYYDSTGRGTLGNAFARCWSAYTNAVEFGGNPTPRPVASTLLIYDEKLKQRRLKRADEHYSKFVTELWYAVRYLVESRQLRNLPREMADELCQRIWAYVRGDKIEVEKKEDMKKRTNRSPDLGDLCAIGVEGARRLGLQIMKIVNMAEAERDNSWKEDLALRSRKLRDSYTLTRT